MTLRSSSNAMSRFWPTSVVVLLLTATGCATTTPPAPLPAPPIEIPLEIRWARRSAEHAAIYVQTYRAATEHLRAVADTLATPDWAVILDADETLLDNSLYQRRRAEQGLGYTSESWAAWAREEAAPALPGAVDFTTEVVRLGGRVVVVTNRDDAVCDETRSNLTRVGIEAAAVLCQVGGVGDKNPRFESVQEGRVPTLPPLRVVMWVGDNIQDFPDLAQEVRLAAPASFDPFGSRYWILPNPMYGSWTRNPEPAEAP